MSGNQKRNTNHGNRGSKGEGMPRENKTMAETRMLTGRIGEDIAAAYLLENGYMILERNYRQKTGEIDIIAAEKTDLETVIIAEVKTRKTLSYGLPGESVTSRKRGKIKKTTAIYAAANGLQGKNFRMDVIEVLLIGREPDIRHITNAF